jgi:hypothetical protein
LIEEIALTMICGRGEFILVFLVLVDPEANLIKVYFNTYTSPFFFLFSSNDTVLGTIFFYLGATV